MSMKYAIFFVGFGQVKDARCHDAEAALQYIADNSGTVMCVSPFLRPQAQQNFLPNGKI